MAEYIYKVLPGSIPMRSGGTECPLENIVNIFWKDIK